MVRVHQLFAELPMERIVRKFLKIKNYARTNMVADELCSIWSFSKGFWSLCKYICVLLVIAGSRFVRGQNLPSSSAPQPGKATPTRTFSTAYSFPVFRFPRSTAMGECISGVKHFTRKLLMRTNGRTACCCVIKNFPHSKINRFTPVFH